MKEVPWQMYPVAIIEDRYNGSYSGGAWLAVMEYRDHLDELEDGPEGDDIEAYTFWGTFEEPGHHNAPNWIAAGNTPDEALSSLIAKNPSMKNKVQG